MAVLLRFAIHQIIVGFVGQRNKCAGHIFYVDALAVLHCRNFGFGERTLGMIIDAPGPAGLIVDRYPGMRAQWMACSRRNDRIPGHDPGRDAPVVFFILGIATRSDKQSAWTS